MRCLMRTRVCAVKRPFSLELDVRACNVPTTNIQTLTRTRAFIITKRACSHRSRRRRRRCAVNEFWVCVREYLTVACDARDG